MSKEWFIKEGGQVCFKSDNAELNGWDTQSLVDCLNGKEIKISDLEAKLAESENTISNLIEDSRASKELLKKQLAEKEKENNELVFIIEEIEQFAWEQLNNENFDKYKAYDEMLTKIRQLTKQSPCEKEHQDKISFAVEQLEKVKETTECFLDNALKNSSLNQSYYDRLLDKIDNQIKRLKEGK